MRIHLIVLIHLVPHANYIFWQNLSSSLWKIIRIKFKVIECVLNFLELKTSSLKWYLVKCKYVLSLFSHFCNFLHMFLFGSLEFCPFSINFPGCSIYHSLILLHFLYQKYVNNWNRIEYLKVNNPLIKKLYFLPFGSNLA